MRVTIRCHYPGSDFTPTSVTVDPGDELGTTPLEVHEELVRRIRAGGCFDVPMIGDDLLPVAPETVREVAVRG